MARLRAASDHAGSIDLPPSRRKVPAATASAGEHLCTPAWKPFATQAFKSSTMFVAACCDGTTTEDRNCWWNSAMHEISDHEFVRERLNYYNQAFAGSSNAERAHHLRRLVELLERAQPELRSMAN